MQASSTFERAKKSIPGGVNSPVRAFSAVGGEPIFMRSAEGAYLTSQQGRRYLDLIGSWGPMVLGHAHPDVIAAVQQSASQGLCFGTPSVAEIELAELVVDMVPSIEQVRMVNSGTEACMTAVRLARGVTGRDKIVKFAGCYHGHVDHLLVSAGSGALTNGVPSSPGVTAKNASDTLTAEYNNIASVEAIFAQHAQDIAAIIVEPVAGNMGVVTPAEGFLESLRAVCSAHGALLIFDEVMTGFRVSAGGVQAHYGVMPDITTLGKIIGGGMPVGAVGASREIMQHLSPAGPVYQAGTLSGHPVAMAAGLATLRAIAAQPDFYVRLAAITQSYVDGLRQVSAECNVPMVVNAVCGMVSFFMTDQVQVVGYQDVMKVDTQRYAKLFHAMLSRGIYLPPSAYEAQFVSIAHTPQCLQMCLDAMRESLQD